VKSPVAVLLLCALTVAACGPATRPGAVYVARRGDSAGALAARWSNGDAALAKALADGRDAGATFGAGERLVISSRQLKRSKALRAALAEAATGRAALARGDYAAAIAGLEPAYAVYPQDPAFAYELGWAYYGSGDYPRAAAALAAAAAAVPEDDDVRLAYALALAAAGRAEDAAALWTAYADGHGEDNFGRFAAASFAYAARQYPTARHLYFEYLKREENGFAAALAREGVRSTARDEMAAASRAAKDKKTAADAAEAPREAGGDE
jgi:thioredoxin-like negative regulator of GroEL